jgi:hypothetical protein
MHIVIAERMRAEEDKILARAILINARRKREA